jgi:Tol biopolymer transport system component
LTSQAQMELAIIDPVAKTSTRLNLPPDAYDSFRMSPDETQIAFGNEGDKDGRIYTYPISGASSPQPLTTPGGNNRYATWTRDSKRIAFQSDQGTDKGIWWQAADRSDTATRLTQAVDGDSHIPESWFDDTLLFSITAKDGLASLWTLSVKNGKATPPRRFGTSISTHFMSAVFSPTGTLVAYTKTERGETTVCVEPFPANSPYTCIERKEADSPKHPRWSPDGGQLYYDPRVGDFEVRDVITRPQLQLVNPRPVEYHPFRLAPMGFRTPYDVTRSGKFLGQVTPGKDEFEPQSENRIVTVLNWVDNLKQKVK